MNERMRFRWHRGELLDSLDTTVTLDATAAALQSYIEENSSLVRGMVSVAYIGHDPRCDWELYQVRIGGYAIGVCDRMPSGVKPSGQFGGNWIVSEQGGSDAERYEISVLREGNAHGRRSFGWGGPDKLIVASDHGDLVPHWVRDMQRELAQRIAKLLNEGMTPLPDATAATLVGADEERP